MHSHLLNRLVRNSRDDPEKEERKSQHKSKWVKFVKGRDSLLDVSGSEVRSDVSLELGVEKGSSLSTTELVSNGVINVNFIEDGSVLEGNGESISNEPLGAVEVVGGDLLVFNARDLEVDE